VRKCAQLGEIIKMKKVIDNKVYNTDTAELIHRWDNGYYSGDFHQCEESLYKTKKGAYFIHGEGGAMSSYAVAYGNSRGGGESIIPLTPDAACGWLQDHDGDSEAETEFPDKIEQA